MSKKWKKSEIFFTKPQKNAVQSSIIVDESAINNV